MPTSLFRRLCRIRSYISTLWAQETDLVGTRRGTYHIMEIQDLENLLKGRAIYGFATPTDSPDYLGWILVERRLRGPLTLEDVEPGSIHYASLLDLSRETPEIYRQLVEERRDIQERPYMVLVMELDRAVHQRGVYPEEEDYRKREVRYFRSLQEVEQLLNELGYSIADIKSSHDIESP